MKCTDCLPNKNGRCENAVGLSKGDERSRSSQTSRSDEQVPLEYPVSLESVTPNLPAENSQTGNETGLQLEQESERANATSDDIPALPPFTGLKPINFQWDKRDGATFTDLLDKAYNEVVHWTRNLFKLPSGKVGTLLVNELSRLLHAYADETPMENIAMKAVMTMPALLLQKPHARSRNVEHNNRLKERLELWMDGDIETLLQECRTIQSRLPNTTQRPKNDGELARSFAKLIRMGNIQAAIRRVTDSGNTGVLPLNSIQPDNRTVKDHLQEKHPHRRPALKETISQEDPKDEPHEVIYGEIDNTMIRTIVQRMTGSAGPSGVDATGWKRFCSSYGKTSEGLCKAIAQVAKRISSSYVDPKGLISFTACRLIALDKNPGVRPIGIGEVLRRIIGKAILMITSADIRKTVGTQQLCAGLVSGAEAGVHAMRTLKDDPDTEAVLMVDATNAFNTLNREAALRNIRILCPALAPILINTYREDSPLFIEGEVIFSREGTTQGDPLAMPMYAIGTLPLIRQLPSESRSVWFADDATAGGKLDNLKIWWDSVRNIGPKFGYTPNAKKSWIIVKEEALQQAKSIFNESGINITTQGKRHLGAPLGTSTFTQSFVESKVAVWVEEIKRLSSIARTQPQAAYTALTHGIMGRWAFLMRSVPGVEDQFQPLEDVIRQPAASNYRSSCNKG